MPPIRMNIILYAQTECAINSCTKINDGINFELNTQNFLPAIVTGTVNTFFCDLSGMELLFIQTPHTSSRKGVMTIVDPLHWLRNAVHVATALQQFVV